MNLQKLNNAARDAQRKLFNDPNSKVASANSGDYRVTITLGKDADIEVANTTSKKSKTGRLTKQQFLSGQFMAIVRAIASSLL